MDNIKILNLVWIFVISVFLIVTVIAAVDASDSTNKPGVIEINISPIKDVYYTGDEININFVLEPNKNGCFAMLTLTKINGTQNVLFQHQRGCKSCGSAKSPLTSKISKSINKKFDEPGIYDIEALMEDAETYKSDFKNIKIIVKDREVEKVMVKEEDIADNENTQIPIVIEVFTRDGCPICYHVDEGAKKLANEYNEKNKNSVILLEHHLKDMLATQAGLDRRIFYDGDEWQNVCNFYALTLLNGEDEDCGGTHNTESDYMNLKNKVENKIIVPTVSMLANASYDKTSLYVDVKIKTAGNEAKNLDIFLFILDDTKVKAYLQKPAKIDKKQNVANLKFLFPYGEISAYKNLRAVAIIQEDKKILNARVIEYNDIREIKILKEAKELKNESKEINKEIYKNITEDEGNKSINMTAVSGAEVEADIIKIANPIKNSINFMYCVVSRDTLFCAISNLFEIAEIKSENIKKGNFSISWSK